MPGPLERLKETRVLLADGAWGSELLQRGLFLSLEPPEAWNLRFPDTIRKLAADYAEYADIITASTFGANRTRLSEYRLQGKLRKINARGVALARDGARAQKTRSRKVLVAGSIGPARGPDSSGIDDSALADIFQEQAACLAEAGADFLVVETMTDLTEALAAVRGVKSATNLEVVCSFAFWEAESGVFQTWSGDSVEVALREALVAGADLVGANCIPATDALLPLVREMRRCAGDVPLWLKPNAGQPTNTLKHTQIARTFRERLRERWAEFRESAWRRQEEDPWNERYWLAYPHPISEAPLEAVLDALGPGVIGGCCGVSRGDIARLRTLIGAGQPNSETT